MRNAVKSFSSDEEEDYSWVVTNILQWLNDSLFFLNHGYHKTVMVKFLFDYIGFFQLRTVVVRTLYIKHAIQAYT